MKYIYLLLLLLPLDSFSQKPELSFLVNPFQQSSVIAFNRNGTRVANTRLDSQSESKVIVTYGSDSIRIITLKIIAKMYNTLKVDENGNLTGEYNKELEKLGLAEILDGIRNIHNRHRINTENPNQIDNLDKDGVTIGYYRKNNDNLLWEYFEIQ